MFLYSKKSVSREKRDYMRTEIICGEIINGDYCNTYMNGPLPFRFNGNQCVLVQDLIIFSQINKFHFLINNFFDYV